MNFKGGKINDLIRSLLPKDQEEMLLLQVLIDSVQSLGKSQADLALVPVSSPQSALPRTSLDEKSLWDSVPEDSRRYLHGLLEAIEIYQSIHGQMRAAQPIAVNPASVNEIRQIRDMCLEQVPWSTY